MNNVPTLVDEYTFNLIFEVLDKLPKNADIVELGSFLGGSAIIIDNKLLEINRQDISLMCIDNWECDNISPESRDWANAYDNFYEKFKENTKNRSIFSLKMDTLEASKRFEDNSIDLLFVDDGHQYPHTRNILEAWLPKVKTKGYIIGHDYSTGGVGLAVVEVLNNKILFCDTGSGYRYQKC